MKPIRSLLAMAAIAIATFAGCTESHAPDPAAVDQAAVPTAPTAPTKDVTDRAGAVDPSDLCVMGPRGLVCMLGNATRDQVQRGPGKMIAIGQHITFVPDSAIIAEPGEVCGVCGDLINDPSRLACDQEAADLFDAFMACACGATGDCKDACSAGPATGGTANYCEGVGADPNVWCKVCMVTVPEPAVSMPPTPAVLGCYDAFYNCALDEGPPGPPFDCALTGLPVCAGGETPWGCNGDDVCPGADLGPVDDEGYLLDNLCRGCCVTEHDGPAISYCDPPITP